LLAVDTSDTAAVAAVIVGIAAGLIALAALVVSYLAWKESRRSADAAVRSAKASEDSARAAAQSAAAEEAALALAQRDAEQRDADRADEAGPQFECVKGTIGKEFARMTLRVVGGPGRVVVDVEVADVPWCSGITAGKGDGPVAQSIRFPPMEPGDMFEVTGHLTVPASRAAVLPLLITVESREDPPRTWQRRVPVSLRYRPPVRAFSV
jgi:hypothetical protein